MKAVDGHWIKTPVIGETQVLLEPKSSTEPGVSMSWYRAGKQKLPGHKQPVEVYGVQDTVNYKQFEVKQAGAACPNNQCAVRLHHSLLYDAVQYTPLDLAALPFRILPLGNTIPGLGSVTNELTKIIGNDDQQTASESEYLFVDAQKDLESECAQPLLTSRYIAPGIAKATRIELNGMAKLDATLPALKQNGVYYAEAARLPIKVNIVGGSLQQAVPPPVSAAAFAQQFGSSSHNVALANGANSCRIDALASAQISKVMQSEVQRKDSIVVSMQATPKAARS